MKLNMDTYIHTNMYTSMPHMIIRVWWECRVFALHYSSHTIGYEVPWAVIGIVSVEKVHFRVNDDGYVA
jgi:hypothetical protein